MLYMLWIIYPRNDVIIRWIRSYKIQHTLIDFVHVLRLYYFFPNNWLIYGKSENKWLENWISVLFLWRTISFYIIQRVQLNLS
jgi:hypothetical protein